MKNRVKIWSTFIALMAFVIGGVPVFGQGIQTLEDGSTIIPILGSNLVQLDSLGRLEGVLNSCGGLTTFTFDDAGNLSRRTAADLKVTDYGYDALNRLIAITNQGLEVATFDHDPNGNVLNHEDSKGTKVEFGYDEMNHITNVTSSVGNSLFDIRYSHDLNGNRTNIVYPGGLSVGYEYEADNRLKSVTTKYANNTKTISFGYDTANRLDGITYPNGVNSTFGLDAEGHVVSIQHGAFVDRTIERNLLGFKKTELIDAGIKPTVPETRRSIKTHNDADQLTSEWVQTATSTQTVDYAYSPNGCLTNITTEAQSTQSFSYDYDNRLKSVDVIATVGSNLSWFVEYLYDASGARVGRITTHQGLSTTNLFVIDYTDGLKRPLAETDASGTITRFYVWSGSQLLCHIEANGDVRYYHSDELGSTLALTKEDGAVTDEFAYMPYGYAVYYRTDPSTGQRSLFDIRYSPTPFLWLGGYGVYYDSATDLHLTLHRAYSSKMKHFIHPDPLGIDGGVNVYAMANRNPVWFIDPYGLNSIGYVFGGAYAIGRHYGDYVMGGGFGFLGYVTLNNQWQLTLGYTVTFESGLRVSAGYGPQIMASLYDSDSPVNNVGFVGGALSGNEGQVSYTQGKYDVGYSQSKLLVTQEKTFSLGNAISSLWGRLFGGEGNSSSDGEVGNPEEGVPDK